MITPLKVNIKKIHKRISTQEKIMKEIGVITTSNLETYGRCLLYLGEKAKAKEYFLEAAKYSEKTMNISKEQGRIEEFVRHKHMQANYYRLVGETERSQILFTEARLVYEKILYDTYQGDDERGISILSNLSGCCFFLGNYQSAYEYGKRVKHWEPPAKGYALGLLNNSSNIIIEEAVEKVIKDIKSERVAPGDECMSTTSLWDWYQVGLRLLGLPSILD